MAYERILQVRKKEAATPSPGVQSAKSKKEKRKKPLAFCFHTGLTQGIQDRFLAALGKKKFVFRFFYNRNDKALSSNSLVDRLDDLSGTLAVSTQSGQKKEKKKKRKTKASKGKTR